MSPPGTKRTFQLHQAMSAYQAGADVSLDAPIGLSLTKADLAARSFSTRPVKAEARRDRQAGHADAQARHLVEAHKVVEIVGWVS
jgi:hypothetical protein